MQTARRTIATMTAAACLGSAGWAIAGSSNSSSTTGQGPAKPTATELAIASGSTTTPTAPATRQGQRPLQSPVTGDAAEKVTAAVAAKVAGATIDRVERDPTGTRVQAGRRPSSRR